MYFGPPQIRAAAARTSGSRSAPSLCLIVALSALLLHYGEGAERAACLPSEAGLSAAVGRSRRPVGRKKARLFGSAWERHRDRERENQVREGGEGGARAAAPSAKTSSPSGVFVLMMTYLLDAHDEGPLQLYKSPMENSGRRDHLRFSAEKSAIYERDFFRSNRSLDWPMFRAALKGNPQTAFSNLTAVCVCVHTYVYRQIERYI